MGLTGQLCPCFCEFALTGNTILRMAKRGQDYRAGEGASSHAQDSG